MSILRTLLLTAVVMVAFAGNSLLCRAALRETDLDAASFTSLRLLSGALMLWLLVRSRQGTPVGQGNWGSALALFVYAAALSFAYVGLSTAMGALLLFGAVQATMIGVGLSRGERMTALQWVGFVVAFGGLIGLVLPGLAAPPLGSSLLMLSSGVAWGIYSLRARGAGDPTRVTAGNFARSVPFTLLLSLIMISGARPDAMGLVYAVASGAITSALGYAIWYRVLPELRATTAATVQLSVPVLAALGGIVLLAEPVTLRLGLAAIAILGGILLVILDKRRSVPA